MLYFRWNGNYANILKKYLRFKITLKYLLEIILYRMKNL